MFICVCMLVFICVCVNVGVYLCVHGCGFICVCVDVGLFVCAWMWGYLCVRDKVHSSYHVYSYICTQAKAIALHHELFSVDNGFLTPTFKAKRPAVKTAFMETFVRLYHELPQ